MNYLDIAIIIILGASVIYSVIKGFIRDAFSLLAVILGIVASLLFYPTGAEMLAGLITNPQIANIVSFAVIFLAVSIVVSLLGMLVSRMIKTADLSFYDRVAGGTFGLVKGYILVAVLVIVVTTLFPASARTSKITPYVVRSIRVVTDILPADYQRKIEEQKKNLENLNERTIERNDSKVSQ
ncbi:MAG: CvpA family protein [Deltaproteobacteria bacterium]|uniref:CvpA family protein n=1 Tax=Candidatus Zymogenus saltonus TaxID=2844893 RepID=A0A9D8KGY6_9DELT|nr:CvpA family protein [Candidatus Zymogenus saltonus]